MTPVAAAAPRFVCAVCALAAAAGASAAPVEVDAGFAGRCRAGSWTPVAVSGARPGDVLHVAAQDPDGAFVRSPPATVDAAGGPARFEVRVGRPLGRLRVENATTGTTIAVELRAPLPAATEVFLVVGDLPAVGRASRLLPRPEGARPAVIALPAGAVGPCAVPGGSGRAFDGVDTVVACGRALAGADADLLAGMDSWIRGGDRLILAAGTSAVALTAGGGPAAGWLPGPVSETVPLRRVAVIEAHARAGGLADRPAAADLRVPLLANRATLSAAIDVFEGASPGDLPLVVRVAHGFGTITWIGLDLDAEPFRGWPGTDTLVARALDGRSPGADPVPQPAASGPPDLAGQLRVALEAAGPDAGFAPVPFAMIAGLGLLYVACIFPLDWWLVSRSDRPWLAWLTLPLFTAAFTLAAWGVARRAWPATPADARFVEVVDVDAATAAVRGRSWLAVWRRENTAVDVRLDAAGQGGDAAVSWLADAGTGFGAIDAPVAHPALAAADYSYAATLDALAGVPLAAVSSRLFEAGWSGTAAGVVESDLARDAQGTLRGGFTQRLPFRLVGCRLASGGWVYDVGDLDPGVRHDLADGRGPRSLAGTLARREALREREAAARWDPAATDAVRILEVAGFHQAAGGIAYTVLAPGRLSRLDLSPLLPLDRAVLVGTSAASAPGWTTAWRVADAGQGGEPRTPSCAARVYRIVIPLGAAPQDSGGAGSSRSTVRGAAAE